MGKFIFVSFPGARRGGVMLLAATLYLQGGLGHAAETAAPPAMPPMAPAGQYHLDKSHASLLTTMGVGDLIDFSIEAEFTGPALATPADEAASRQEGPR